MTQETNTFATAFMVAYALPDSSTSEPAYRQRKSSNKLKVYVVSGKKKNASRLKEKIPESVVSLLQVLLASEYLALDPQSKDELKWELMLQKPLRLKYSCRRYSVRIRKYHPLLLEFQHDKLTGTKSSHTANCSISKQAPHRVRKKSPHSVSALKANDSKVECVRSTVRSLRSPDEIQDYMKKKNQLRRKEKKEALAQSQAALAARKEKMKVLEMERRARLHIEASNRKERPENYARPQWDSNVSAASTCEVNGPWSKLCYPLTPIDFPLPKPVDSISFSSIGLESKTSTDNIDVLLESSDNIQGNSGLIDHNLSEGGDLYTNGLQNEMNSAHIDQDETNLNTIGYEQEATVSKVCSSQDGRSEGFSSMESFNIEGRGFSLTSDRTKSFRTHQGMELSAGPHPLKIIPKNVHKGNLFQQAYDGKRSTFLVCSGDEAREIIPSSNKRKASACNFTDRYRKSSERNSFVCARSGSLHSCMQTPTINCPSTGTTNDVKRNTPPLPQYLTYHLERFPSQQERDALTERKRVALLKVLAQQLITRLNASESHPSYLHDPNVQAHAYSLRSNLEKFQRDLHAAIKVLGACHSQSPKNKNSSYIVLPKVPERRGIFRTRSNPATESQRGVDAPELEDTSNKQPRVLCGDIRIERKSSPDSIDLANSVLSKTREEVAVSSEQKSTTLHGETTEEIKEVKKSTCTFQDLESRLLSFCPDSKSRGMYKERHTWDNQLLDKELEKLEAEIKETKLRMARNLLLTHRVADTTSQTSPMSISPRCSAIGTAHVGSLVGGNANTASDIERSSDMPILSDDPESVKYVHGLESETIDGPSDEKLLRQPDGSKTEENVFPLAVKYPTYEVTTVEENCDSDLHKPLTELLSGVSREEGMTISNNIPRDLTTSINGKTESCEAHSHVRSVEVSQRAQEPGTTGRLTVLFKQGFKSNAEVLVNTVMEALMQELLDSEISDMLPQNTDVQCRPNIRDMKKENSEYANLGSAFTVITSNGRERSYSLSDSSTTSDSSGPTSLLLAQEASNACLSERQVSYNDLDEWTCEKYHEPLADSPINASFKVYNDSFKAISKRLVDRYVKEILYIQGLFCASSLLELYASGKTLALVWEKKILDSDDFEEMLYGKLVMEAICECMDHKYQQFYVPSFFLFFQPCPDDRHLERILVKTVNEHADAACEGGFSLEYILHKSLDEEDWGTAHYELVELIHGLSEHVMGDLIDDCVSDLIGFKTKRTRLFNVNVSNVDPTAQ